MELTLKQLSEAIKYFTNIIPLKKKATISRVRSLYYKNQNYAQVDRCCVSAMIL